jgi:hypothetical protein
MTSRFVCVHGHFYQPPRENPWLGAVESQPSAAPFHDWNARITAECYAPNARCRILDSAGRIARLVNNYDSISFNVGPTLLGWLERHDPTTYSRILEADRRGIARFGGHGPAIAQVYNHIIMPLANERDKRTQVAWGIADFKHRFGRSPEGMWLAETAADNASLIAMAEAGIKFTVLSPHQAARVKPGASDVWIDVRGGQIDPTKPYRCSLHGGKSIAIFFYDGAVSQAIAFERLLQSGDKLARRLLGAFRPQLDRAGRQLVAVSTDGETYGHHVAFGDMALAYALDAIRTSGEAELTIFAEYLEKNPPVDAVEIIEPSAWSCTHGVGRWNSDCGCSTGGEPGWHQSWRGPLRAAFDNLRDRLAPEFEAGAGQFFADPWAARDGYIALILDRRPETVSAFLAEHAGRDLNASERVAALRWLELQHQCLLMYTSCGWFFDELNRLEPTQVMAYAGRAAHLAEQLGIAGVEESLREDLAAAKSNVPASGDGRKIYDLAVRPLRIGLDSVAGHTAVATLFAPDSTRSPAYAYAVEADKLRHFQAEGKPARMVCGRVRIRDRVTEEAAEFAIAAIHLGELDLRGGVRPAGDADDDLQRDWRLEVAFSSQDFGTVLKILDDEFAARKYSLKAVFHDERDSLLRQILAPAAMKIEEQFRRVVDELEATMLLLHQLNTRVTPAYRMAEAFIVNQDLRRAFERKDPDQDAIRSLADRAALSDVPLEFQELNYIAAQAVARQLADVRAHPTDVTRITRTVRLVELVGTLGLKPDLWQAQNDWYDLRHGEWPDLPVLAKAALTDLGRRLNMVVD